MSAQKNKTVLAATLAIIAVFLLGGASFTFFPIQQQPTQQYLPTAAHIMWTKPAPDNNSITVTGPVSTHSDSDYYFSITHYYPMDTICIGSDGALNSTNAPIQHQGTTYTLTGNIVNQTLLIQKDNITLNGAGYTLQGWTRTPGDTTIAIKMANRNNITITDFNINQFATLIFEQNSTNLTIKNSNITAGYPYAILMESTNQTTIVNNTFLGSMIELRDCSNNVITGNTFGVGDTGIMDFDGGGDNVVTKNTFTSVKEPIILEGANSDITQNTIVNADCGISVDGPYFDVSKNSLYNSTIAFFVNSNNSEIWQNDAYNCSLGVMLNLAANQPTTGNNSFVNNNFRNCRKPVLVLYPSDLPDHWDNGKEGNYWSSYNGSDGNGDGVGDSPYTLAENCTDNYPLMQPYTAASSIELGTLFFAGAAVTALVGAAVIVCVYAKFRGRS